jgi:AraC-like DNA-binding protein
MDAFGELLDGPRARGAFLLRSILDPPWSMRIQDQAPLTLLAIMHGEACVVPDRGELCSLRRGDVAIILGPDPYIVADDPTTPPQVIIHPGQRCSTPQGEDVGDMMDLGVRTWGNSAHGSTTMFIGTYQMRGAITQRLLDALPALVVLSDYGGESPLLAWLAEEIVKDEPGQEVVLDRLLDLLLVAVLRTWFSRPEADAPAWYRARTDPVVGRALRMLQNDPAHPWTVASLASATSVSRAALARRFTELVGEPPMAFLAGWRLALAADLLRDTDATIGAIARQVGYGSSFALSTAFKRVHGLSPHQHRAGAATGWRRCRSPELGQSPDCG